METFQNLLSQSTIKKQLLGHHSALRQRITNLKQKRMHDHFQKLSFPTLESATYVGITAAFILIGINGLIMRIPSWIFNIFSFLGDSWPFLMWIPSWAVFAILNNLFVWHYKSEDFFEKRGGRTKLRKGIDRMMSGNILRACASFFVISPIGISDLITLYQQPERILGVVLVDASITVTAGILSFLCFHLFLMFLPKKR